MAWFLLGLLLFSNWLWFVAFREYRIEIKKHLRKSGYDQYKYTGNWYVTTMASNIKVGGPFNSKDDAEAAKLIAVKLSDPDARYFVEQLTIEEVENGKSSS